jgi:hypothetical protein
MCLLFRGGSVPLLDAIGPSLLADRLQYLAFQRRGVRLHDLLLEDSHHDRLKMYFLSWALT